MTLAMGRSYFVSGRLPLLPFRSNLLVKPSRSAAFTAAGPAQSDGCPGKQAGTLRARGPRCLRPQAAVLRISELREGMLGRAEPGWLWWAFGGG